MEHYPHLDLGFETQSVHTLDELERSDALSYLGKISVGDLQVMYDTKAPITNTRLVLLIIRIPNPPSYAIIPPPPPT